MVACDPRLGVYLTTACMFRGASVPAYDVEAAISATRDRNANFFAPWIPNNIMSSLCDVPPPGLKSSATLVGNNTAIGEVFKRSQAQFSAMVRRRAFVHWVGHLPSFRFATCAHRHFNDHSTLLREWSK